MITRHFWSLDSDASPVFTTRRSTRCFYSRLFHGNELQYATRIKPNIATLVDWIARLLIRLRTVYLLFTVYVSLATQFNASNSPSRWSQYAVETVLRHIAYVYLWHKYCIYIYLRYFTTLTVKLLLTFIFIVLYSIYAKRESFLLKQKITSHDFDWFSIFIDLWK